MRTAALTSASTPSALPADWATFYAALQTKGHVPDATVADIGPNNAVFRGMCLDLTTVKERIRQSAHQPKITTLYTDVLLVPDQTDWLLQSAGLVIFARRIEVAGSGTVILDYRQSTSAQLVVFAREMTGKLTVSGVESSDKQPTVIEIDRSNVAPGISIAQTNGAVASQTLALRQGIGFQLADDMPPYLNNTFIFGALLCDQNPALALSLLLWVKDWTGQSDEFEELFFRSASLAALLNAQINAKANGAVFVPYLTDSVYTELASAFAGEAGKYERDYIQLNTQKVLTAENIALAKTLAADAQGESAYVNALIEQAEANYDQAVAAVTKAQENFNAQRHVADAVQAKFQQIGIPDYERAEIVKAIFSMVKALATFGVAIASMAVGGEATAPAAAEAVGEVEAVVEEAEEGSEIAKMASELAETMKKLKKLIEGLQKIYVLAQAIKGAAANISAAKHQIGVIQKMQDNADGTDLSAADGWAIYKLQTDDVLKQPVEKHIGYAKEYKQSLDILVIYGQSLAAAQLAVIKASQESAALAFRQYFTRQREANLQKMVDSLKAGEAPILAMMQQFYHKYLDAKSSLFAALKNYQASYFYWALRQSEVQPKIIDPVSDLEAGIQNITKLAMDNANALEHFSPPPQTMKNMQFLVDDPLTLKKLQTTGETTWTLPLDDPDFAGMSRVRVSKVRVWLEGTRFNGQDHSVYLVINTAGNYLDHYRNTDYQFSSNPLTRSFKYAVANQGQNPDWKFADGALGFVQIDGDVDKEVAYAYFEPTPFSEWTISLKKDNADLDYSKVSRITMYFEGTTIGSDRAARAAV